MQGINQTPWTPSASDHVVYGTHSFMCRTLDIKLHTTANHCLCVWSVKRMVTEQEQGLLSWPNDEFYNNGYCIMINNFLCQRKLVAEQQQVLSPWPNNPMTISATTGHPSSVLSHNGDTHLWNADLCTVGLISEALGPRFTSKRKQFVDMKKVAFYSNVQTKWHQYILGPESCAT